MTDHPVPGQPFPRLDLPRVGGGRLIIGDLKPGFMTVLNVYRGLHCPRCADQLADIVANKAQFDALGVDVISISTDPQDRAEKAVAEWGLGDMAVGYDLSIGVARSLGLSISHTIREAEPALFAEAAIFFIQRDGRLWGSSINTFPFLRPTAEQLLDAVGMAKERNYPPRGDVAA
ncbi:MAG TPA: redoxin domain-containing protein [Thermohalobaculum sp.]|nr:redoxin domain-containing protein [Thermohalobaculum sp.]